MIIDISNNLIGRIIQCLTKYKNMHMSNEFTGYANLMRNTVTFVVSWHMVLHKDAENKRI